MAGRDVIAVIIVDRMKFSKDGKVVNKSNVVELVLEDLGTNLSGLIERVRPNGGRR